MTLPESRPVQEEPENMELVRAVCEGDRDALAEVYERYADVVYRMAYWITESPADAADVTQDVFVGLPEALPTLRSETRKGFEAWLKTVTVRAALQGLRRRKRRAEVSLSPFAMGRTRAPQDVVVDRITLDRALGRLTETQRAVFTLKEIEGFTHREIGEILGITFGASEARLHRAKRKLLRLLAGDR